MQYSVIIPTHNEGQKLVDTVNIFAAAVECCDRHQSETEIVVVDDQSTDDSIERVQALDLRLPLKVVQPEKRCGTARARRAGVDASSGDVLINTDAHAHVDHGWLHDFEDPVAELGPRAMERTLFGARTYSMDDDTAFVQGGHIPSPDMHIINAPIRDTEEPYPVMTSIANSHYMSRQLYDQIGGYLPIFMAPWGIDEEIGIRLWMMGGECRVIPTLQMDVLYRTSFPYHVSMLSVTYNRLLMARMQLDYKRFMKVNQELRGKNEPVDEAIHKLLGSNIGRWVDWMRKRRRRSIDDLFSMFGIEW